MTGVDSLVALHGDVGHETDMSPQYQDGESPSSVGALSHVVLDRAGLGCEATTCGLYP